MDHLQVRSNYTPETLGQAVGDAAAQELGCALDRIRHCLEQLNNDQVWSRPHDSMNSIGNVLLHLRGNLRQWIVTGLTEIPDDRNRPAEFAERNLIDKQQLLANLSETVQQAQTILRQQTSESLLQPKRIQGFDINGIIAIFDTIPHFRGHTQEIIHQTRSILGPNYQFAWNPTTPEQGA